MAARKRLAKTTDYETSFRCGSGTGILREEVWMDSARQVVRYNLAFLLPHLLHKDNGRVLGYDNAHGFHERHHLGTAAAVEYSSYPATARQFYREVEQLRRHYENADIHRRF